MDHISTLLFGPMSVFLELLSEFEGCILFKCVQCHPFLSIGCAVSCAVNFTSKQALQEPS
jgi:hypothetical protein